MCDITEAKSSLDRFLDPECLHYAQTHPQAQVRTLALAYLREWETEDDPYSRDVLAALKK